MAQFKLDAYNKTIKDKYQVVLAIDDNQDVISMWKLINIQAWKVEW